MSYRARSSWRGLLEAVRPTTNVRHILAFASILLFVACKTHSAWTTDDSRFTGLPPGVDPYATWEQVPDDAVAPVNRDAAATAESMLLRSPAVSISTQEATHLATFSESALARGKPYLLRGVVLNEATGHFYVYMNDSAVLVSHGSLGKTPFAMTRRPIVAILPRPPEQVFLACEMAE